MKGHTNKQLKNKIYLYLKMSVSISCNHGLIAYFAHNISDYMITDLNNCNDMFATANELFNGIAKLKQSEVDIDK